MGMGEGMLSFVVSVKDMEWACNWVVETVRYIDTVQLLQQCIVDSSFIATQVAPMG